MKLFCFGSSSTSDQESALAVFFKSNEANFDRKSSSAAVLHRKKIFMHLTEILYNKIF